MEEECGSTSPASADVAEQKGITSDEPPADEPLALVKKKIKIEPGIEDEKDEDKHVSVSQKVSVAQTSSFPLLTTGANALPQTLIYTTNGVTPSVPQLVDLIPTAVNGKTVRPFKAYNANRELLGGLAASSGLTNYSAVPIALSGPPGAAVPLSVPTVVVTTGSLAAIQTSLTNSNGGPTAHLMTLATEADKLLQKTKDPKSLNGHDKAENGSADEAMTPGSMSGGSDSGSAGDLLEETIEKIKKRAGLVTAVEQKKFVPIAPAPAPSNSSKKSKKSRNAHPDQMKDEHYWERRRKNNEAAKRSRDARRAKEDQIAIRAALLEQENMRLRIEVAALKEETVKLRAMLYNKK